MKPTHSTSRTKRNVKRILVTIGVTAGVLTVTASQASAGLMVNHSEPTLRPSRGE
jgi:hypothetical protein